MANAIGVDESIVGPYTAMSEKPKQQSFWQQYKTPLGLGALGAGALGMGALGRAGYDFGGTPEKTKQLSSYAPYQQQAKQQLVSQIMQLLGGKGGAGKFDFTPIEEQARSQFASKTIPSIAERFTAMGDSQRSSAFQNALGSAGSQLEQGLAALKSQYGLQQQGLLQNLLQMGLSPEYENIYEPEQPGMLESTGQSIMSWLPLLGSIAGGFLPLPGGSKLGELGGSGVEKLLSYLQAQ